MSEIDFVAGETTKTHTPIADVVDISQGSPDFSDIEAEYANAGYEEPQAHDWSKQEHEVVPDKVLGELKGFVYLAISFAADMACGIANKKPFKHEQIDETTDRVLGVLKYYPKIVMNTGTPKSRAWAALGMDVGKKAMEKKNEPPATIYPDGSEAEPPANEPQSMGGFNTGGNQFGGQADEK